MEAPEGFTWILPDALAAMPRPRDLRKTLEFFKEQGIEVVISLTELGLNEGILSEFDLEYHHIPVQDFCAPEPEQIDRFVELVSAARAANKKAVVHCLAGKGRTGTMIACYLVSLGRSPEEALAEVRNRRPGSVETEGQEEAVRAYAKRLREHGK